MSLAIYAAPFENDKNEDIINDKKKQQQSRNKTFKKYPKENFDQQKVNSVLEQIHSDSKEDNDVNDLGDYYQNPPPKPESVGVQRTVATEQLRTMQVSQPRAMEESSLDLNNFNSNYTTADEYYSKFLPGYKKGDASRSVQQQQQQHRPYYANAVAPLSMDSSNDILLKKINYMINLLEESQDEKTNNVTEEVVLYSFLGIFIIFVVDSFARVGKYVR